MEILIVALFELLAVVVPSLVTFVVTILAMLAEVVVSLVIYLVGRHKPEGARTQAVPKRSMARRILGWGTGTCLVLLILSGTAILLGNTLFLPSVVRAVLRPVERRTGIAVNFEKADGDLLRGRIHLTNATLVRRDHPTAQIDLTANDIFVDLALVDFLRGERVFETVRVSGIDGTWIQTARADELKPRRQFTIKTFVLADTRLAYSKRIDGAKPLDMLFQIDRAVAEPLRSELALFDLLLRGNITGRINDIPFTIKTEGEANSIAMNDIPAGTATDSFGAPLNWLDAGKVDVKMTNRGVKQGMVDGSGESDKIDAECSFVMRDFHVRPPKGMASDSTLVLTPLLAALNAQSRSFPLAIRFSLNSDDFKFSSADGFKDSIQTIASRNLADKIKEEIDEFTGKLNIRLEGTGEKINEKINEGIGNLRDVLQNKLRIPR